MARQTDKSFQAATRYMFANRFGLTPGFENDHDFDNNKALTWADSTDTISVPVIALDSDSVLTLDHGRSKGARGVAQFTMNANSGLATQTFFVADRAMIITGIEYVHGTAGTDAGAVTAYVSHETGTQAPGTGLSVMSNTFNCKGTINVVQNATINAVDGNGNQPTSVQLAAGDRLSMVFTGTLTTLAGVSVSVYSAPGFKEEVAVFNMNANASLATQGFFVANRDMVVTTANMLWSAAGTDAGAVTIDITHETGTTAPGSGTSILTAAVSAKTTANTVNTPALTGTVAQLKLLAGDRLSVKFTGTLTALAGVVVSVYLQASSDVAGTAIPYYGQVEDNFHLAANGSLASQGTFIADRDYEIVDASAIWSTAGTDGGTVTYDFEIAKGTTAVGSGTSISTGAVSVKTTANTVSVLALSTSRRNRILSQGDRINLVLAGTLTSLAGFNATVSLLPR